MARQLVGAGFSGVMATPHVMEGFAPISQEVLNKKVEELRCALEQEGIPLNVYPGAEIMATPDLIENDSASMPSLNGSRYLLIEIPLTQPLPLYMENLLFSIRSKGKFPILAHPERCYAFLHDPTKLLKLRKYKLLYQVNIASFGGHFGAQSQQLANKMLRENLISFLGTDAHRADDERVLCLSSELSYLKKKAGEDAFDRMLFYNTKMVLDNEPVDPPIVRAGSFKKKRSIFSLPRSLENILFLYRKGKARKMENNDI